MSDEDSPEHIEPIDLDALIAPLGTAPESWQSKAPSYLYTGSKPAICESEDLARVLALPRRPQLDPDSPRAAAISQLINQRYRRERTVACDCRAIAPKRFENGANGCIQTLNITQCWSLYEMGIVQGLEGAIGVGHGKTVLDILAALPLTDAWVAENARRGVVVDPAKYVALLLVPPGLVGQLELEYRLLAQHFRVPSIVFHSRPTTFKATGEPVLHVYPYSKLSRAEATTFFGSLQPNVVIADEAHHLGDPGAVRTGRLCSYIVKNPSTRFANWTGSMTDSSLEDYGHLIAMALRERSPLPLNGEVVKEWANALDPTANEGWVANPGALLEGLIETGCQKSGEHVYVGFHRRLVETLGVVATTSPAISAGLEIDEREPLVDVVANQGDHVPNVPREDENAPNGFWPGIADALASVRGGVRPDGEELVMPLEKARCARELASGFFYRWIFPRHEPDSVIKEWRKARKDWRCELREKLQDRAEHLDSPYLCQLAAMRYYGDIPRGGVVEVIVEDEETGEQSVRTIDTTNLPVWAAAAWPRWKAARPTVEPQTEPVWIDDYLARDAMAWGREHRGIIWYDHNAFGRKISDLSGFAMHGGGQGAGEKLVGGRYNGIEYPGVDGKETVLCSITSHGTGRDGLQLRFDEQLVGNPQSSNKGWEQLLGRLHRIGQRSDVVKTWFYRHTQEVRAHVDKALSRALYVESTIGASQKLNMGFRVPKGG